MTDWQSWTAGGQRPERYEALVEIPGWTERPWVLVRALTEAEALERESIGLIEEYEVVQRGLGEPELRVRRVYDLVAMAEYEWGKCLLDWCLPDGGLPAALRATPSLDREGGERADGALPSGSPVPGGEAAAGEGEYGVKAVARHMGAGDPEGNLEFLRGMGPSLAAWVREVLDAVNCRLPEQHAAIAVAKKNCGH